MKPPEPKPETSATQALEGVLRAHSFLAGMKPEHLRTLNVNAMMMFYQPGEVIFREGDPANRFYLIQKGKVTLESSLSHPFQSSGGIRR
jgi:CRP-like cAMP-binding protein